MRAQCQLGPSIGWWPRMGCPPWTKCMSLFYEICTSCTHHTPASCLAHMAAPALLRVGDFRALASACIEDELTELRARHAHHAGRHCDQLAGRLSVCYTTGAADGLTGHLGIAHLKMSGLWAAAGRPRRHRQRRPLACPHPSHRRVSPTPAHSPPWSCYFTRTPVAPAPGPKVGSRVDPGG